MTPQSKWAAETGLDPDDYSVWDNDQSSQRARPTVGRSPARTSTARRKSTSS